jgi:hypothetical protein
MADPNLVDFYSSVARFEKRRQNGYAFEAAGTLGNHRRLQRASSSRRFSFLRPLILVALCGFGLKAMIYHVVGTSHYIERVAELDAGQGFDRLGGWLMQVDPVSKVMAAGIAKGLTYLPK